MARIFLSSPDVGDLEDELAATSGSPTWSGRRGNDAAKRAFDVAAASILFVVTLPVQGVVAVLTRRDIGSPVLFRQTRPGRRGEVFTLVKFRTMRAAALGEGVENDGDRLTPLGRRLRATSLDELPTLVNVIRGDMSLVGPRPLLVEYLDRYSPEQARRHEVRPGVTGLAQVSGRNALTWEEKFALDVQYVDSHTFLGDLWILWRTIAPVFGRRGIAADGEATMSEFRGASDA